MLHIYFYESNIGNRTFQTHWQLDPPLWVLRTHPTVDELVSPKKKKKTQLFCTLPQAPCSRTWVSPKPRQDDPLSRLTGKSRSTGGQRTQGSPRCVGVSGGLMSPDQTATEAERRQKRVWVTGPDREAGFGRSTRKKETSLNILNDNQSKELRLCATDWLTWQLLVA